MTYNVPIVDFVGPLSKIGENLGRARKENQLSDALSALGPNATADERARALEAIDPAMGLRYRIATDRSDALKEPPAYITGPDGRATFNPGGPADPATVKTLAEARGGTGGKTLPRIAVNDLTEKGTVIQNTQLLHDTFKDGFGGWKVGSVGDAANLVARNTGIGNKEAATWWQDYQRHINIVRNQLFGSALTLQERQQWDKANITPGMTDDAIRTNLQHQADAERRAARKLARTYATSGYGKEAIEEAVGFSLDDDLPIPEATPSSPQLNEDEQRQSLENAKAAIAKNPSIRAEVIKRLEAAGIPTTGL
jgi:hypothetical protein